MNPYFLAISLLSASGSTVSPVAALRVDDEQSSFMVTVTEDAAAGYRIAIDCTERCARAFHYHEITSDTPLGLFSRDQNGLVFSTWSAGSIYRVVVWSVSDGGVRKVAELPSRGRPDFLSGPDGTPVIQTYEAASGVTPLHRIKWKFADGRFVRSSVEGN